MPQTEIIFSYHPKKRIPEQVNNDAATIAVARI